MSQSVPAVFRQEAIDTKLTKQLLRLDGNELDLFLIDAFSIVERDKEDINAPVETEKTP